MAKTLNLSTSVLIYDDTVASNNPGRRPVDWKRTFNQISVEKAAGGTNYSLAASETKTIYASTRSIPADTSSEYELEYISALGRYRLAYTGTGTAPGFRTPRSVALASTTVTLVVNANLTVTVTSSGGSVWGNVQVGDTIFIPGTSIGYSASNFDSLNEGFWEVLSASAAQVVMTREAGVFSGASEAVAVAANTEFRVFSSNLVQVGDTVNILDGLATSALGTYKVAQVTATEIDFTSAKALADETGTPLLAVYPECAQFTYIETDQKISLTINGGAAVTVDAIPGTSLGLFCFTGPVYSLVVTNGTTSAEIFVIRAGN